MRRVDPQEQQQTATMVLTLAQTIAPLIIQFPYMNWPEVLDLIGEAYNIPDLARLLFNATGLQLIQQGQAPGQMPGIESAAPQGGDHQPTFATIGGLSGGGGWSPGRSCTTTTMRMISRELRWIISAQSARWSLVGLLVVSISCATKRIAASRSATSCLSFLRVRARIVTELKA
jgi:hypothetical protein